jgi:allophanate hydrolase subunit 2
MPAATGAVRILATGHLGLRAFAAKPWTVVAASRSGVRLAGGPMAASGSVPSAPLLPGVIQLTPGGESILIGPDGGVTGGYPVVAAVAAADLDRLSLMVVGDLVTFRVIEVEEAVAARREQIRLLRAAIAHPDHLP